MTSKKILLLSATLAILGGFIFSQLSLSPAVSFVIGVLATVLLFTLSNKTTSQTSNEPAATKTLYVGNLPYKANESQVRDLFSEYGEVFAVRLMKDKRTGKRRGFGFVVVSSNDAEHTISQLNNAEYMDRTLKVRIANEPKSGGEEKF